MNRQFSLLIRMTRREMSRRFTGADGGWIWAVVQPLLLLGVYSVVFGMIFQARAPESLGVPFVGWLAVALWPWLAFSDAVLRASESMTEHAALISKVPMRRELLVVSTAAAAFGLQLVGYAVVLVVMVALGIPLRIDGLLNALLVLVTLFVFAGGLALIAATLAVFFRDVSQVLPTLMMLWFFLTPILYAPQFLPESLQPLIYANPVAGLMGDLRDALFAGQMLPGGATLAMLPIALALFALGLMLFRRMSPYFQDFL
jgi:ABC-type polysaccharide/polyol phosphate export permease